MKKPSHKFNKEYRKLQTIIEKYGIDSDQATIQMTKVIQLAPDDIQKMMFDKAKEMGLVPQPSGYRDDGEPLYDTATLAKHFGISEEEVQADINRLEIQGLAVAHRGNVNLLQ